mgnify:FL=1|jgi:uncharacterized membrane protein YccC
MIRSRFDSLSLPTQQLLSGATAGIGVLLVAVAAGVIGGTEAAAAAVVGAMCTSIVDIPDPPDFKPPGFIAATVFGGLITLAIDLSIDYPVLTAVIVGATSFVAAMVTAYGRTTLPLCMAMILAMVFALGTHNPGAVGWTLEPLQRAALVAAGGAGYAVYGMIAAYLLEVRYKRLALIDAMQAFAAYIRCKGQLYDPDSELDATYRVLIERQVALMEKVQTARNLALRHLSDARHRRMAAALSLLIDAFESVLSSQADFWMLRRHYGKSAVLPAIRDGAGAIADLMMEFADEIRSGKPSHSAELLKARWAEIAALAADAAPASDDAAEAERARLELNAVIVRLSNSLDLVLRLQRAMRDKAEAEAVLRRINPAAFLPHRPYRWRVLLRQLRWRSPVLRYALRLTAAMLCAFAVAELMTHFFAHGSWILLTVAVIMRASYSTTKQRQKDRLIGNLLGCVVAAVALHLLHDLVLLALIFISIGIAHAYAAVRYRITAVAGAVMALLMLHFLNPMQENGLIERLLDTGIGSLIAFVFSFMLPSWERQSLQDRIRDMLRANRQYAHQTLRLNQQEQTYRLARKAAFDSIGEFAGMIRRIPDEPGARQHDLDLLFRFMAANYRLTALLAALLLMLRRRRAELPPVETDKRLAAASLRLRWLLGGGDRAEPVSEAEPLSPSAGPAAAALERRLREAEVIARQIHDMAAQIRTSDTAAQLRKVRVAKA